MLFHVSGVALFCSAAWRPNGLFCKIRKTTEETYGPAIGIIDSINDYAKKINGRIDELIERTKKAIKHPYIEQYDIVKFQKKHEKYSEDVNSFDKNIKEIIVKKKNEILRLEKEDTVLDNFGKYISVGKEYSFAQIMEIIKEGKCRYEFEIPPGFRDWKKRMEFKNMLIWLFGSSF